MNWQWAWMRLSAMVKAGRDDLRFLRNDVADMAAGKIAAHDPVVLWRNALYHIRGK